MRGATLSGVGIREAPAPAAGVGVASLSKRAALPVTVPARSMRGKAAAAVVSPHQPSIGLGSPPLTRANSRVRAPASPASPAGAAAAAAARHALEVRFPGGHVDYGMMASEVFLSPGSSCSVADTSPFTGSAAPAAGASSRSPASRSSSALMRRVIHGDSRARRMVSEALQAHCALDASLHDGEGAAASNLRAYAAALDALCTATTISKALPDVVRDVVQRIALGVGEEACRLDGAVVAGEAESSLAAQRSSSHGVRHAAEPHLDRAACRPMADEDACRLSTGAAMQALAAAPDRMAALQTAMTVQRLSNGVEHAATAATPSHRAPVSRPTLALEAVDDHRAVSSSRLSPRIVTGSSVPRLSLNGQMRVLPGSVTLPLRAAASVAPASTPNARSPTLAALAPDRGAHDSHVVDVPAELAEQDDEDDDDDYDGFAAWRPSGANASVCDDIVHLARESRASETEAMGSTAAATMSEVIDTASPLKTVGAASTGMGRGLVSPLPLVRLATAAAAPATASGSGAPASDGLAAHAVAQSFQEEFNAGKDGWSDSWRDEAEAAGHV